MRKAEKDARDLVRERSNGVCEVCDRARATNYSHRIAAGQGGKVTPANGVDACGSGTTGCHGWIERNPEAARGLGLRVRNTQEPTEVPVRLARIGLVLLDDEGGWTPVPSTDEQENDDARSARPLRDRQPHRGPGAPVPG